MIIYKKMNNSFAVRTVCTVITLMIIGSQLISFATLALSEKGAFQSVFERNRRDDPDYYPYMISHDGLTEISKDRNVFVFVVDRFDRVFADVAFKNFPELYSELDGFTYFNDTVSLYGHTYPSVPYMLTGVRLDCESDYREGYLNRAFDSSLPLDELKKAGYKINYYTDSYYGYTYDHYISNYLSNIQTMSSDVVDIRVKEPILLSWNMVRMGLFRVLPHFAKNAVGDITSRSCNELVYYDNGEISLEEYSTDLDSLESFYEGAEFTFTNDKVYSFIHTDGCHDMYFGGGDDPDMISSSDLKDAKITLGRNFDIINSYLKVLKEAGLYKDATIIITGDHGSAIDDCLPLDGIRTTALFIKPSGKDGGGIARSSAQVCHDDLWATVFKSEGIRTENDFGRSAFEISETEKRTRTYIWHESIEKNGEWTFNEYTYTIKGSALDFGNWKITDIKKYDRDLYD